MDLPQVFIASSSEGLDAVKEVCRLLGQKLRKAADVKPWTRKFELSAAYIESLEKISEQSDFGVFVMTPDDFTISRKQGKPAPRDNVIFELGLFMGSLGRDRCFILKENKPDLKLPSDLLGVHGAGFQRTSGRSLKDVLKAPCELIAERIEALGPRYKLSRDMHASQIAIRRFCESLEGAWWERILSDDHSSALSFFRIETDPVINSVSLDGSSFNAEGRNLGNWKSVIGRVDRDQRQILYHWKGFHTLPEGANFPYHGFGEMEFDKPVKKGGLINRGKGKFWDVDEARPENTTAKSIQLKRIMTPKPIAVMTGGKEKAIQSLVKKTLRTW